MGILFRILLYDRKIRKKRSRRSYRRKKRQGVKDSLSFDSYFYGNRILQATSLADGKTKRADFFDRRLQMSFVQIWEHPSAAIEMRFCSADGVRNASIQIFFGFFRWNRSEGRITSRQKFSGSKVRYFQRHEKSLRVFRPIRVRRLPDGVRYTPKPRMSFSTRCLSCGSGTAESSGVKSSSSNSPANAVKML